MGRGDSGGKGLGEAKIILDYMRPIMDRLKEYAQFSQAYARDLAFVDAASQTGLRVSEVAHIKKEDILEKSLVVTRRKKRVLVARPIHVNAGGLSRIRDWGNRVEAGYIFPGAAGPCLIHRRPKFEVENCPKCKKCVAPKHIVKKKGDRISQFFQHLSTSHNWDLKKIEKWIAKASVEVTDQFCGGGHVSIRHWEGRWQDLMKDLGIYMPGRGVHSVRHAAITRVYNQTRSIKAAQEFAGHESLEMTKGYTHIDLVEQLEKVSLDW